MAEHDHSYKLLFSHPEMVRDLLDGFVREDWLAQIDYASLEKVSCQYVTDDLRERADDIVWRVRWGEGGSSIYLLLEFQSTIDVSMALRILTYVGLLYQDLIKAAHYPSEGPLPAVLPIVLYNGSTRWHAAEDLSSLIQSDPHALTPYQPRVRYLLLDERHYPDSEMPQRRNLVAAVFRLENSRTHADVDAVVGQLMEWLSSAEHQSLRRAFGVWIGKVILARFPGMEMSTMDELQEIRAEIAERYRVWGEQIKHEGHQQGEAQVLLVLLRKRFGALPEAVTIRVKNAPVDQVESWAEELLDAASLDALFGGAL
jgi:predicted transposase YdaD